MKIVKEGTQMTVSEMIIQAISNRGMLKQDVAKKMGWSPAAFSNRLKRNSISVEEFKDIAAVLNYEVKLVDKSNELVVIRVRQKGIGAKASQMIDGVTYNTEKSDGVCHSIKQGGCFFELYKDLTIDKFFIVSYIEGEKTSNITVVNEETAKEFYESCNGTYPSEYFKE